MVVCVWTIYFTEPLCHKVMESLYRAVARQLSVTLHRSVKYFSATFTAEAAAVWLVRLPEFDGGTGVVRQKLPDCGCVPEELSLGFPGTVW
jgi:hypothetical protein